MPIVFDPDFAKSGQPNNSTSSISSRISFDSNFAKQSAQEPDQTSSTTPWVQGPPANDNSAPKAPAAPWWKQAIGGAEAIGKGVVNELYAGSNSAIRFVAKATNVFEDPSEQLGNWLAEKTTGKKITPSHNQAAIGNWIIQKTQQIDASDKSAAGSIDYGLTSDQSMAISGGAQSFANAFANSIPIAGPILAASNASDALANYYQSGNKKVLGGDLMTVALNIAISKIGGGETLYIMKPVLEKLGLKYFSDALVTEAVQTTVKTGVKAGVDTTAEDATSSAFKTAVEKTSGKPLEEGIETATKTGVKSPLITSASINNLSYALLKDGAYGTGYQLSNDLQTDTKITPKNLAIGFGYGAIMGAASRVGFGLLGKGFEAAQGNAQGKAIAGTAGAIQAGSEAGDSLAVTKMKFEQTLGTLNQAQAPADILTSIQNAYQDNLKTRNDNQGLKILTDLAGARDDLIHTQGPIQAAEKMGIEVNQVSERPTDTNGQYVDATYKDGTITVWDQNPNAAQTVIGEAIWDNLDEMAKVKMADLTPRKVSQLRRYVMDEVKNITPNSMESDKGRFIDAVNQVQTKYFASGIRADNPKLTGLIESTYGKILYVSDDSLSQRASKFADLKATMTENGVSREDMDAYNQRYQSGESVDTIQQDAQSKYKFEYQSKNGEIPDSLWQTSDGTKMFQELQNAEAGKRIKGTDPETGKDIWIGQKSSFPQWISESLRRKSLLDKVMKHISDGTIPKSGEVRALYDEIHNELRSRQGLDPIDTSNISKASDRLFGKKSGEINTDEIFGDQKTPTQSEPVAPKSEPVNQPSTSPSETQTKTETAQTTSQEQGKTNQRPMPVESTGKVKESAFYKRAQGIYSDMLAQNKVTYNESNHGDRLAKAIDLIEKDPVKANQIAHGIQEAPEEDTTAIQVALIQKASDDGNMAELTSLVKQTTLEATRKGQDINILKEINAHSPAAFIKQLIQNKMLDSGLVKTDQTFNPFKSSPSKIINNKIDQLVDKMSDRIKDAKINIDDAQKVIDNLRCK